MLIDMLTMKTTAATINCTKTKKRVVKFFVLTLHLTFKYTPAKFSSLPPFKTSQFSMFENPKNVDDI